MADRYKNYAELLRSEKEGNDFRVRAVDRESFAAIVAPHGGCIEFGTSEIAAAIAGNSYSFYCFEGLKKKNSYKDLHITSSNFDEPRCLNLIKRCRVVVAVHGCRVGNALMIGGLDASTRDAINQSLNSAGFPSTVVNSGNLSGASSENVCNRGLNGAGVQLEIPRKLRDALRSDPAAMALFADNIRQTIYLLHIERYKPLHALQD